ncbi:TetR/AcrR family transcriptional regulator [Dactylosporangium sp. CA-092794]|uniref:TetR/AcrR family transcriptional regulator n=1 Tax=Dactylosporangium sp. CA-092794 TaxID=3239929 RepID=UPI003D8E18B3
MARWQPDAKGRLQEAAMELFVRQGLEETTVAQIAERAGLNKRTFFRHFPDKRDVLFSGQQALEELYTKTIAEAPDVSVPMAAVAPAVVAAGEIVDRLGEQGRQRQRLIAANPALQEREAIKRVAVAATIREALCRRGVPDPVAALTAEAAVGVFKVAYARWGGDESRTMADVVRETIAHLDRATATHPTEPAAGPARRAARSGR